MQFLFQVSIKHVATVILLLLALAHGGLHGLHGHIQPVPDLPGITVLGCGLWGQSSQGAF